eukprot:5082062-Amphidinium_carterae.2
MTMRKSHYTIASTRMCEFALCFDSNPSNHNQSNQEFPRKDPQITIQFCFTAFCNLGRQSTVVKQRICA